MHGMNNGCKKIRSPNRLSSPQVCIELEESHLVWPGLHVFGTSHFELKHFRPPRHSKSSLQVKSTQTSWSQYAPLSQSLSPEQLNGNLGLQPWRINKALPTMMVTILMTKYDVRILIICFPELVEDAKQLFYASIAWGLGRAPVWRHG